MTDRLPGSRSGQDAIVGIDGRPDDPVTTALEAVAVRRRGRWIGRPQSYAPHPWRVPLHGLDLESEVADNYDVGEALGTIWPVYHDLTRPAAHDEACREAYRTANLRFATAAASQAAPGATVWIHDYHLQLVPGQLRRLRPDLRIGFSLHTPFPSIDLFHHLPLHEEILAGLLGADLVAFPTAQAAENFLRACEDADVSTEVIVCPTSVDSAAIAAAASRPHTDRQARDLRTALGHPRRVVLSIDSADESHGVDRKLRGIFDLFATGDLRPGDVAFVQIVNGAPESMSDVIAREVARINGAFATVGRPCVHYLRTTPNLDERVVLYRAADVLVCTPLRAAVSNPALEFVAAARPGSSVVLSQFSGTVAALPEAIVINPYDLAEVRAAILAATSMEVSVANQRLRSMRRYVTTYTTHHWARQFLISLQERVNTAMDTGPTLRRSRHSDPQRLRIVPSGTSL